MEPKNSFWLAVGACSGFLAVAAGAFGAHALRHSLSPEKLGIFETGARYQMYHALVLCVIGLWGTRLRQPPGTLWTLNASGWFFTAGTLFFSGSLYLLALGGPRWLGPATPIGGVCFLAGWAMLAWSALVGR